MSVACIQVHFRLAFIIEANTMKTDQTASSGIVVEVIKTAGNIGDTMIRDLTTEKVPTDWEQSFIVCLYKGKDDALDRGNNRGLNLTEQAEDCRLSHKTGGVY